MRKKNFHSQLFNRTINKTDKDYKSFVIAELLYRIYDLDFRDCSCMDCVLLKTKYSDYLKKTLDWKKSKPIIE